ncbi:MAG: L-seryl-tRNA(Sec) selenium transferase [Candidatus Marinimicrobia bacterium]|nr:L-seryl-tRNA(Sec) selenium transferase [Candidatus Neomarinimicrobiota bacterium]
MTQKTGIDYKLSDLPSVDALLNSVADIELPHIMKKNEARKILDEYRSFIMNIKPNQIKNIETALSLRLLYIEKSLRKVINGTGVVIHTNLGRSPYSRDLCNALDLLQDSYVNLELDLSTGKRGSRHDHLRPWIQAISQAESGILVNNNAAAVLLALNSLADKKEVLISRGQLVEIGGSFRIPDILKKAGSKLVEVGTTNRTHVHDYESAITPKTKLLLWVHSSNYRISGYTKEVSIQQLIEIGKKYDLPVMADLGSGALISTEKFGLQKEPLVSEIINSGVDIVTFSVDKLLGGPQGGIIAGKQKYIQKIEKNHLLRALRPDKAQILLTLQSLRAYSKEQDITSRVPVYRDFSQAIETLRERALGIKSKIDNPLLMIEIIETQAQVGSGASPSENMDSIGVRVQHSKLKATGISKKLRANDPAIMGRINEEAIIIDLKAVRASEDTEIIQAFNTMV